MKHALTLLSALLLAALAALHAAEYRITTVLFKLKEKQP